MEVWEMIHRAGTKSQHMSSYSDLMVHKVHCTRCYVTMEIKTFDKAIIHTFCDDCMIKIIQSKINALERQMYDLIRKRDEC